MRNFIFGGKLTGVTNSFQWTLKDPIIKKAEDIVRNTSKTGPELSRCIAQFMRIVAVADGGLESARDAAKKDSSNSYQVWSTLVDLELKANNIEIALEMAQQAQKKGRVTDEVYVGIVNALIRKSDYTHASEIANKIRNSNVWFLAMLDVAEADKDGDYTYLLKGRHWNQLMQSKASELYARCARIFSLDFTEAKRCQVLAHYAINELAKCDLKAALSLYESHTYNKHELLSKLVPIAAKTDPDIACRLARDVSEKTRRVLLLIEVAKLSPSDDLIKEIESIVEAVKPGKRIDILIELSKIKVCNIKKFLEEEVSFIENANFDPKIQCLQWIQVARADVSYIPKVRKIVLSHDDLDLITLFVNGYDRSGRCVIKYEGTITLLNVIL